MTAAIGSRGRAARALAAHPPADAACRGKAFPCITLRLLSELHDAYARPLAYYHRHLPGLDPSSEVFVATTDTFARSFMAVLSDVARRHHLYVAASNDQAPFRRISRPGRVRALADPDRPRPRFVYVATSPHVDNEVVPVGPARRTPARPADAAQRRRPQPQGAADADRAGAGADAGAEHGRRRPRQPAALPHPGHAGPPGLRHEPARLHLRRPAAGTDPCTDTAR